MTIVKPSSNNSTFSGHQKLSNTLSICLIVSFYVKYSLQVKKEKTLWTFLINCRSQKLLFSASNLLEITNKSLSTIKCTRSTAKLVRFCLTWFKYQRPKDFTNIPKSFLASTWNSLKNSMAKSNMEQPCLNMQTTYTKTSFLRKRRDNTTNALKFVRKMSIMVD